MINYPNGKSYKTKTKHQSHLSEEDISISSANRGMNLEEDINISNNYYKEKGICLIYKRPTPINVVSVDYKHNGIITKAYFEHQSTTDYNGIYKGKYIDFEAKNTKNKTSFPLNNISPHQIEHLKLVITHGGIAFFIIQFELLNKVFLLDAEDVIHFYTAKERKSIPYSYFIDHALEINRSYNPRLNYIEQVDKKYF